MKNRTILAFTSFLIFLQTELPVHAYQVSNLCEKSAQSRSLRCPSYRQTTAYTCGPAAVMALLNYYRKLSSNEMNKKTEMQIAHEMQAGERGTSPSQVEAWLSSHGFSVSSGVCVTSRMIKRNIDRGVPTIVSYNKHWLLAKGYKNSTQGSHDEIYFADSSCGTTVLSAEIVDTMWSIGAMRQPHCGIHSGYYIIATPRG